MTEVSKPHSTQVETVRALIERWHAYGWSPRRDQRDQALEALGSLEEQLEATRDALREIVNKASGSSDVFAGHAARIARAALESNPASSPKAHAGFEERRGGDAAGNPITWVWCLECGKAHQSPEHCPAKERS